MNWPQARLWLIIAFLALDILLAFALFGGKDLPYFAQRTTPSRLSEQLARYGLELEAALPPDPGPLPLLRLERMPLPPALLAAVFPDGIPGPTMARTGAGGTTITYKDSAAVVTGEPSGRVSVYYMEADAAAAGAGPAAGGAGPVAPPPVSLLEPVSSDVRQALLQAATAWAQTWDGLPDDRGEPRVLYDPATGNGLVRWRQLAADVPLYGSYLHVWLTRDGAAGAPAGTFRISHAEWRWFQPQGPVGEPRPGVPPQTALLRLAGHLESMGEPSGTITAVSLGYYTGLYEAESWEVPPVWRLDLADGRYFYVNALTGELETD